MDLKAVNSQALVNQKPIKKLKDFTLNNPFKILAAKIVKGKFGKVVLLELEDCSTFLPSRMTEVIRGKENHLSNGNYAIVYKGEKKVGAFESSQFEIIEI